VRYHCHEDSEHKFPNKDLFEHVCKDLIPEGQGKQFNPELKEIAGLKNN